MLFSTVTDIGKSRNITVHRKNPVGADKPVPGRCCLHETPFEVVHIGVLVAVPPRFAEPYPVDDRGVVELIGDDCILGTQKRFEHAAVGVETGRVEKCVFGAKEPGDCSLELFVYLLRTADKPHG